MKPPTEFRAAAEVGAKSRLDATTHCRQPSRRLAASAVFIAMLVAALSLWTAIPLGWIYIGSKMSQTQFPSAGPYMVVALGVFISVVLVAVLIGLLNGLYMRIVGSNRFSPMRPVWLRSVRDASRVGGTTTVVEAVLISSVALAGLAFAVWFFGFAGSPLPNQ
ncbi:MAG: hypothetical protein WB507_12145 [Solirubrobacterales bacterium]